MNLTVEFLNPNQTIRLPLYCAEMAFIKSVEDELVAQNVLVSNKAVILAIIRHLENERCPQRIAFYRSALELVVRTTPDDL